MAPPQPRPPIIIAFDLYGTLISTSSITTDLAKALDLTQEKADLLASRWRQYQLEYTWRLSSMSSHSPSSTSISTSHTTTPPHLPFAALTRASLLHAAAELDLPTSLVDAHADALVHAYDELTSFPDVLPALHRLDEEKTPNTKTRTCPQVEAVIFSNGDPSMLARSVTTSPTLRLFHPTRAEDAPAKNDEHDTKVKKEEPGDAQPGQREAQHSPPGLFTKLISASGASSYKPSRDAYEHLLREAVPSGDYKAQAAVWLVSANAFDVIGARAAGIRAAWVDRAGKGWVDRLGDVITRHGGGKPDLTPTIVARGVVEAVDKILEVGV